MSSLRTFLSRRLNAMTRRTARASSAKSPNGSVTAIVTRASVNSTSTCARLDIDVRELPPAGMSKHDVRELIEDMVGKQAIQRAYRGSYLFVSSAGAILEDLVDFATFILSTRISLRHRWRSKLHPCRNANGVSGLPVVLVEEMLHRGQGADDHPAPLIGWTDWTLLICGFRRRTSPSASFSSVSHDDRGLGLPRLHRKFTGYQQAGPERSRSSTCSSQRTPAPICESNPESPLPDVALEATPIDARHRRERPRLLRPLVPSTRS